MKNGEVANDLYVAFTQERAVVGPATGGDRRGVYFNQGTEPSADGVIDYSRGKHGDPTTHIESAISVVYNKTVRP